MIFYLKIFVLHNILCILFHVRLTNYVERIYLFAPASSNYINMFNLDYLLKANMTN